MHQQTSLENRKKFPSQGNELHPQLQAVLGNLDVQLEDELARYRRKKPMEAEAPQPSGWGQRSTKLKNLEVFVTPELKNSTAVVQKQSEAIAPELTEVLPQQLETTLATQESDPGDREQSASSLNLAHSDSPNLPEPNGYLASSEQLIGSLENSPPHSLSTQLRNRRRRRSLKNLLSPLSVGVSLLFVLTLGTIVSVISGRFSARQPVVTTETPKSPSSQPPLPQVPRSPNLADKEFVPLDIDTLATLSPHSEITNKPTVPEQLLPTVPVAPDANSNQNPTQNTTTNPPVPGQTYPSLENLNTALLPQSVQDNLPNARASNANNANNTNNNTKANANNASNANNTNTNANANNTNTNNTNNANNAKPGTPATPGVNSQNLGTPNSEKLPEPKVGSQAFPPFYYVVIDYQNEDSLFLARQVIPDAYVREFPNGVKVQMAAFEDTASAERMVQYLKEQGFAAQVYRP